MSEPGFHACLTQRSRHPRQVHRQPSTVPFLTTLLPPNLLIVCASATYHQPGPAVYSRQPFPDQTNCGTVACQTLHPGLAKTGSPSRAIRAPGSFGFDAAEDSQLQPFEIAID